MSAWVDKKYAMRLAGRLELFKVKSSEPFLANFRCPICGDSRKSRFKARGYFYTKGDAVKFSCKNCGESMSIKSFVRQIDPGLYDELVLETLVNDKQHEPLVSELPRLSTPTSKLVSDLDATPLSRLSKDHTAWRLVTTRKIPEEVASEWLHTEHFYATTNALTPDKFNEEQLKRDHPRLIIPFTRDGALVAFQGRSYSSDNRARYIMIVLDKSRSIAYNIDHVRWDLPVIVLEGPIDASFLSNAVAAAGSELVACERRLRLEVLGARSARIVLAFDNQPRHKEVMKKVRAAVNSGHEVCFWPKHIEEKDVNDMILAGMTAAEVESIVLDNAKSGLAAQVELMVA